MLKVLCKFLRSSFVCPTLKSAINWNVITSLHLNMFISPLVKIRFDTEDLLSQTRLKSFAKYRALFIGKSLKEKKNFQWESHHKFRHERFRSFISVNHSEIKHVRKSFSISHYFHYQCQCRIERKFYAVLSTHYTLCTWHRKLRRCYLFCK